MTPNRFASFLRLCLFSILLAGMVFQPQSNAYAAANLTITPLTWNVVGLDSNNVNVGPNNFPVGARVCNTGDTTATNVSSTFIWDIDPTPAKDYIALRPGSNTSYSGYTLVPLACVDFYYEVQVTRDANAYEDTRRYYITATADTLGTITTPTPREIFVEHLISQNRNAVSDVRLNGVSIPAGGTMNLMVGNTYTIQLVGSTATQGYEQLESFINFPNTIFQVNSVSSTYSADAGTDSLATTRPYANGCNWVNDPNSPNYRSCVSTGKYGGNITVTYNVTILGGAGTSQTLNTLIYDFSGSSYHYNADFSTGARLASIIGPSSVEITKTFSPRAISPGGTSVLTFRLTNPTTETITGVNFTDSLLGGLRVASTPNVSYSGCGAGAFSPVPVANATSLSFSNGTIAPNSTCTITVSVTADTAADYPNTTSNLFINTSTDTGNSASDTLRVSSASACVPGQILATWTFPSGSSPTTPAFSTKAANVATATTSTTTTASTIDTNVGNPAPSWAGRNFPGSGAVTGETSPYFQFVIDTSIYTSVQILLSYARDSNWGGGSATTPTIFVWSSTTGSAASFSQIFSSTTFDTTFRSTGNLNAAATGTNLTYFRINAVGATNANAFMQIDTVTFTGCLVPSPAPTMTKAFLPDPIVKGASSTLTFTINNTAVGNVPQSGISFTDVLPDGLSVANGTASACNGTNNRVTTSATRTISLTGGSLAAGGSCTFNVTVTGTLEGAYENITGFLSSNESGTSTSYAIDTLTVIAPPDFEKSFSPSSILINGTSTLQFIITNPNQGTTLNGIGFTDTLPAGVTAVDGIFNYCNGVLTIISNSLTFIGGSVNANSSCTFTVSVMGTTTGTKNNSTSVITSLEGGNGNAASATLVVSNPQPLIGLLKQISTDGTNWVKYVGVIPTGDIYYQFTITNDGETTLNNISVIDPNVNTGACTPALPTSLAVGASASCVVGPISISSVPTPNPFVNTATVTTSTYTPGTEGTSSAQYGTKSLSLDKTADRSVFLAASEIITYSYLVTNDGGYPLLGPVTVTDNRATVTCPVVSTVGDNDNYLDPGESLTCTATYLVTAGDVAARQVTNIASALADGATSNTDTVTVTLGPDLTVTKTNNVSGTVALGSSFTWTLTVLNSGNTPATFTSGQTILSDPLPAGPTYGTPTAGAFVNITNSANLSCSIAAGTLECIATSADVTIGATTGSFAFSFTVAPTSSGSLSNTVTVDPGNNTPETNEGNNTGSNTVFVTDPSFTIAKDADVFDVDAAGDIITYTVTLNNTGNVALTGVSVNDPLLANLDCDGVAGAPFTTTGLTIAVNGTLICTGAYTVTQTDIDTNGGGDGLINNTVTAFTNETPPQNTSTVVEIIQSPAHTTLKSETSTGTYVVGDAITYDIVVTNTGNLTLTGVTVSDSSASVGTCTPAQPSTLAPNATMTCPASYVVTQADLDRGSYANTATGDTDQTPPSTSTVMITLPQNPAYSTVKSETSTAPYVVGNTITYNIVVTNTGTITLTGVTASDNSAAVGTCTPAQPSTLAPTASMTCLASHMVTQADVDSGSYVNTATGDSNQTPPNTNTVTVNFTQIPAHTTVKSETSTGPYAVGDTITYDIVITNTGNMTLTAVTVSDSSATIGTCTPAQPSTLAPNATMTCPATHLVTQADIDNGSYANTATGDTNQTPPSTSTVTVSLPQNPAHTTVKSETSTGPYSVGDSIVYDIVVMNTGNITLSSVTVSDNGATVGTCTPAQPSVLAPNTSMTCPATHLITQADVDSGSYVNTATGDTNQTPPSSSTETVNFAQNPVHTTVKSETSTGPYAVGDTITYNIVVTNTGNVTITAVTVTDNSATVGTCTPAQPSTLAPNATMTCPASHTVTQADVDSGSYVNTATGDSNQTPPSTSTATVNLPQNPAHTTLKGETSAGPYTVGDTIIYSIVVTNTGNITLTGVTASDNSATVGTCTPAQPSTLAPNASMTCSASHLVTQADVNTGSYANTATAGSSQTPPSTSAVTVNFPQNPAHATVKSETSPGPYGIGDTITYNIVVTNTGNITLTGVTVSDNSAVVGTCTPAQPSTLAPNASMTCPASHAVTASDVNNGSYVNTATGDSNETSPNTSTVTVPLTPALVADPALSKAGSPTQATVGETVTFTLTVTNAGTTPATNVVVTDPLPAMFDVVTVTSVYPAGGNAGTISVSSAPAPYTVTVNLGTLNVTDVVIITITTMVNSLGNPPIINSASLTTAATTDIVSNNAAAVTLTLR